MGIIIENSQLEHHEALSHSYLLHGKVLDVLLCGVSNPDNIASCIRTADAIGSSRIYLNAASSSVFKSYRNRIMRGARCKAFEVIEVDQIEFIKQYTGRVLCLEITRESLPIFEVLDKTEKSFLIVAGNESDGLSESILRLKTSHVHLPMCGRNSSMNVANSVAIACYAVAYRSFRQVK